VLPHWSTPYDASPPSAVGEHSGGDALLLQDLFGDPTADPLHRAADHVDGARSIVTGIAANVSLATGRPVDVDDLVKLP
jgi:hypothetical protein